MLKFLKKVNFLEKSGQENNQDGTQPLKFFVQKSWFDMPWIAPEFETKHAITSKVRNLTKIFENII